MTHFVKQRYQKNIVTLQQKQIKKYGDEWTNRDGIAVVTCNDGFRPVTFLLEATDEEAGPFYQKDETL